MSKPIRPSRSLAQVEREFSDDASCKAFLAQLRWPDGVVCPRCKATTKVYASKPGGRWTCKNCSPNGYRFSVLTGSVFENTNIPLRIWFKAIYLMCESKKGISALQISRMIDPVRGKESSYRTAWYMCHRIRAAMMDESGPLGGIVEVDESYIGGKDRNRHKGKKSADMRKAREAKLGEAPTLLTKRSATARRVLLVRSPARETSSRP